jgi:hypothetical protein
MKSKQLLFFSLLFGLIFVLSLQTAAARKNALVFLTDFGVKDGAVSSMKGVAYGVDSRLAMFDITHEIPAFNIWEAAYRLNQAAAYWPSGTVFVSVVDPGVGTQRRSVVLKTRSGHFFGKIKSFKGLGAVPHISRQRRVRLCRCQACGRSD